MIAGAGWSKLTKLTGLWRRQKGPGSGHRALTPNALLAFEGVAASYGLAIPGMVHLSVEARGPKQVQDFGGVGKWDELPGKVGVHFDCSFSQLSNNSKR